jgi:hypothetical protein
MRNLITYPDYVQEAVTASPSSKEDSLVSRLMGSIARFIRGRELTEMLDRIKSVATFDDFRLKFKKGHEGANQFVIDIIQSRTGYHVGRFVAFVYKDPATSKWSLQIQKVEVFPEYRGQGIMRRFYRQFNEWLKDTLPNFGQFTSDFVFLYDKATTKYDGFNMWEDMVRKGLARRLGPDEHYQPPAVPPKDGMWRLESGYALV